MKLQLYGLDNTVLEIRQGFAYLEENKDSALQNQLSRALSLKESELLLAKHKIDSTLSISNNYTQLLNEAKAITPELNEIAIAPLKSTAPHDSKDSVTFVYMQLSRSPNKSTKELLENWLKVKLNKKIKLVIECK
jgi:hypothetical protein